jgi:hypothetical protein
MTGVLERPVTLVFQGLWTFNLPETSIDVIINFFATLSGERLRAVGRDLAAAGLCGELPVVFRAFERSVV